MDLQLRDPHILITGGSEGIGLACARAFSVDGAMQRGVARITPGRMTQPGEIANAALFLASSKASYITGVVLAMDGATTPMVA